MDEELTLPFIFVADDADPPPELATFKSMHLDWVAIPAIFIPDQEPAEEGGPARRPTGPEQEMEAATAKRHSRRNRPARTRAPLARFSAGKCRQPRPGDGTTRPALYP